MSDPTDWVERVGSFLKTELFTLGTTKVTPIALLMFAFTVSIAAVVGKVLRRGIGRYSARQGGLTEGMGYALGRIAQLVVVLIGILIALENIGVSLSTVAALGAVLGVGIGLGLKDLAQNFVSGIAALVDREVERGDFVIIGDSMGMVDEISMRGTRIITRDRIAIIIPNSELISGRIINVSKPSRVYRVRISVGVAYGTDTRLVERTLLAVARNHERVLDKPKPAVFFHDFGASSLDFELAVWLNDPAREPQILSELRFAIDDAFRKRGISIPFPQRDVHLHEVKRAAGN
ncbi:MAG TPA: mechanosensitive ion channel domain-containing protein [Polyangiaceae bacterium]|jgi:potassium-dependent mechanosensitive channel|nr:mechanosensitive ion channel domain-containing protein [Polyangiaceae bacterium]